MLHQFTWQQFLIAALILTLVWYTAIVLLFYRGKISTLLLARWKLRKHQKLKREWEEELEQDDNQDDMVGRPAIPEGVSEVEMHMLGFTPKVQQESPEDDGDIRLGLIPDIQEELKGIFRILEKENGSKEDFISLFDLISSKYPKIKGTSNQQALNDYIRENLLFDISDDELNYLWK